MDGVVTALSIAGRFVGPDHPCFIIAEIGVNHDGEIEKARQLIDAAVKSGADAVKFQTFVAERLATPEAPKAAYQLDATSTGESQLEMLRRLELDPQAHEQLMRYSRQRNTIFMSTPFDEESADLLADLGVPAFKMSSGDITNLPFQIHVARKRKPMIVSTGMATLGEVEAAVRAIEDTGNLELALLHCVSNYPARDRDINLRAMQTMAAAFRVSVGYSDHTLGLSVPLAAVALGACIIEKHLTLNRSLPGPDHRASLEPDEFAMMVEGIRTVESALGDGCKKPAPAEAAIAAVVRRSLVAAKEIPAGSKLTNEMFVTRRPGTGLAPSMRSLLVGRRAKIDIREGTVLTLDMVE